jgi:hypothetical protein
MQAKQLSFPVNPVQLRLLKEGKLEFIVMIVDKQICVQPEIQSYFFDALSPQEQQAAIAPYCLS